MIKLLTHNDLDGVSCGILAKLAFGKEVHVRYNSVSGLDREVAWFLENDREKMLYITDLSVNEENEKNLEEFHQSGGKVSLIDHHKSALHFNDYEWASITVEEAEDKLASATSLFYDHLVQNEHLQPSDAIAEYVELVRQYDTWEWERNENWAAQRLNALFFLVSIDEFEEKMIERLKGSDHFEFDEFEKRILDMEEDKIERYIRRKRREIVQAEVNGLYAGIVYAESYHSELGNELGKEYPHLDYIAILNMGSKRIGFRTIHDDVDVSEVAGRYGGGGHAKASGCSMSEEAYQNFVTGTFHTEPLHEDAKRNRFNLKEASFGTLYTNKQEDRFFISSANGEWRIKQNDRVLNKIYHSFAEAERYLKRNHEAWLVRDDVFVQYLMELVKSEG